MKARLVPLYFQSADDPEFSAQVGKLKELLREEADILEPRPLGSSVPEVDAVLLPQVLGDAYRRVEEIRAIPLPIIVATSEFGMVNMWDWEIVGYLRGKGLQVFAPYTLDLTKNIVRSLVLRREMQETSFLLFQDNPGEGMQASIFKRFFWWENECAERIQEKFGIQVFKKSFKVLGEKAKNIPDRQAAEVWRAWNLQVEGLSERAILSAVKIYIALKEEIEKNPTIKGAGMNCLNESFYSDTTPCLAWCMLFTERDFIWACEGDLLTLATKFLVYRALRQPIMMSNVYPFLMGQAALKHERIEKFPEVEEPENHLLIAHCGYFGLMPPAFAASWVARPKVLAIVDENAHVVDARFPEGPVTLVKLDTTLEKLFVVEGTLEGYVQYPDSDCRNGGIIRISDGHRLMENLPSHHILILPGHHRVALKNMARVLRIEVVEF
ncbi:MAG: hypothetical protein HPY68_02115 [Candidatus Atribacteria bacterium]|nr:hypothetical protein [Candidatus Atribacteria bacterium]